MSLMAATATVTWGTKEAFSKEAISQKYGKSDKRSVLKLTLSNVTLHEVECSLYTMYVNLLYTYDSYVYETMIGELRMRSRLSMPNRPAPAALANASALSLYAVFKDLLRKYVQYDALMDSVVSLVSVPNCHRPECHGRGHSDIKDQLSTALITTK